MMEVIEDLPAGVVGIAAKGKLTHEDYTHTVIPAIEKALEHHHKVSVLFHLPEFEGAEMAALWDDTAFGLKHWSDFKRIALVTDEEGARSAMAFFAWMIPAEVKVFPTHDMDHAREWLAIGD